MRDDGERAQGVPFGMRRQHYLQIWSIVEFLKRAHELATKLSRHIVLEESGMVPKIELLRVRCCSYLSGGAKAWGKGRNLKHLLSLYLKYDISGDVAAGEGESMF